MGRRTPEKAKIICPPPSGVDIINSAKEVYTGNCLCEFVYLPNNSKSDGWILMKFSANFNNSTRKELHILDFGGDLNQSQVQGIF